MEVKGKFFHVRQSMKRLRTAWEKRIYETFRKSETKGKPPRKSKPSEPVRRG